jgi:hypothetical protein
MSGRRRRRAQRRCPSPSWPPPLGGAHPKGASWGGRRPAGRRGALAAALPAARLRPLPRARAARSATPPRAGEVLEGC